MEENCIMFRCRVWLEPEYKQDLNDWEVNYKIGSFSMVPAEGDSIILNNDYRLYIVKKVEHTMNYEIAADLFVVWNKHPNSLIYQENREKHEEE